MNMIDTICHSLDVPYFLLAIPQKLAGQYHALLEEFPTVLAFLCILELHLNRKTNITTI